MAFYEEVPLIKRLVEEVDTSDDSDTLLRETYDNGEYYSIHGVFDLENDTEATKPYFLILDNKGVVLFCTDDYGDAIEVAENYIHTNVLLKLDGDVTPTGNPKYLIN